MRNNKLNKFSLSIGNPTPQPDIHGKLNFVPISPMITSQGTQGYFNGTSGSEILAKLNTQLIQVILLYKL